MAAGRHPVTRAQQLAGVEVHGRGLDPDPPTSTPMATRSPVASRSSAGRSRRPPCPGRPRRASRRAGRLPSRPSSSAWGRARRRATACSRRRARPWRRRPWATRARRAPQARSAGSLGMAVLLAGRRRGLSGDSGSGSGRDAGWSVARVLGMSGLGMGSGRGRGASGQCASFLPVRGVRLGRPGPGSSAVGQRLDPRAGEARNESSALETRQTAVRMPASHERSVGTPVVSRSVDPSTG